MPIDPSIAPTVASSILTSVFASAVYDTSKAGIKRALEFVAKKHPDLAGKYKKALDDKNQSEAMKVADELINTVIIESDNGYIDISGIIMKSIKDIKFDHKNGEIKIANTSIKGSTLFTGGNIGSTGTTTIGGTTTMETAGTKIEIGNGASIKMTGGASIRQT